ncbi:MAG TPA: NUDIX domain-containing protein [Vicinamibacteria bacterium]
MTAEEQVEERLNVYDAEGRVVGAARRSEAKRSGQAVGAVNVLLVNARGEVLLQRRPEDKENGGLWDKSVGGHVSAGEEFDQTAVREAGEELFDDGASPRVRLASSLEAFAAQLPTLDLSQVVLFRRASLQLGLRDVRHAPGRAGVRNVVYHVAVYLGRTDVPREGFRPQADEIADLAYFEASMVDSMLLRGELAPNMAFLWLTHARPLLALSFATIKTCG